MAIAEWRLKVSTWWNRLAPREKVIVGVGGLFCVFLIVYEVYWSPLQEKVGLMRQSIQADQQTLAWMKSADAAIKAAQQNSNKIRTVISPIALLSVLRQKFVEAGLQVSLKQLKQTSDESIDMQLQKVDFDRFIALMIEVSKAYAVIISQLSISAVSAEGIVDVNMSLTVEG